MVPYIREECRLRVYENRILRRIVESKRDANGEWRRLHNEELYTLYHSLNIGRLIKSRQPIKPEWKKVEVLSKF